MKLLRHNAGKDFDENGALELIPVEEYFLKD